jgi:hypothetical protein
MPGKKPKEADAACYLLLFVSSTVKMEAMHSTETSVNIHRTMRRYTQEVSSCLSSNMAVNEF